MRILHPCLILQFFLVSLLALHATADNNVNSTTTTPGPYFRATYKGRFQLWMDGCSGPPPVVQADCGGSSIRLLNVSHPSIHCQEEPDNKSTALLTCRGTCNDTSTSCPYVNDGTYTTADGPWGEIVYQCEGNSLLDIDTAFRYLDSGEGACSWRFWFDNSIYHLAQLGVLCSSQHTNYLPPPPEYIPPPPEYQGENDNTFNITEAENTNGVFNDTEIGEGEVAVVSRAISLEGDFVYDDYFFECSRGDSASLDFDGPQNDAVLCAVGKNCEGEDCDVDFHTLEVHAKVKKVDWHCVEKLVEGISVHVQSIDAEKEEEEEEDDIHLEGNYTVRFQAGWSVLLKNPNYWYDIDDIQCFQGSDTQVRFACHNGDLHFIETSHKNITCSLSGNDLLECIVPMVWIDPMPNLNEFYTVTYECTSSNQLPSTKASYKASNLYCTENVYDDLVAGHALQMGHFCAANTDETTAGEYQYLDYYHECGRDNQYLLLDAHTQALGDRFTCLETTPVAHQDRAVYVPAVIVRTAWTQMPDPLCYTFQPATTNVLEEDTIASTSTP